MDKYFKRVATENLQQQSGDAKNDDNNNNPSKKPCLDINVEDLCGDPGKRERLSHFNPNLHDRIRRYYLQKGPCQPRDYQFPRREFVNAKRRFNPSWFDQYKNWLEYSISQDAAYCLCCYLFKKDVGKQSEGDAFVSKGFTSWNKSERLREHVGKHDSLHNKAWRKCEDLMNQEQSIQLALQKQSYQVRSEYRTRLTASVDCIRFLLRQGLAFRGHDESEDSENQGNFLELLHFLADHCEGINKVTCRNAPSNDKMASPDIQNDIIEASARETINLIVSDLSDEPFAILIDESRDINSKEQMAVVLRYVNKEGVLLERFFGILHVSDTSAKSLKSYLEKLLCDHNLSLSRVRGQGYDGASNMRGEFNGLKSLILKENSSAYYVHCFAHQLQLTLVALAKNESTVASFFSIATNILNVVGASCKRQEIFRESQATSVGRELESGELVSGRGLNQERGLHRPSDTRWGSHYDTLICFIVRFSAIMDVLEYVSQDGTSEQKNEANVLLILIQSFDFVFSLHLMKDILGLTNELSKALQRKDQDIVNAMKLVDLAKERLQKMRNDGWDPLMDKVSSFCKNNEISAINLEDMFVFPGRSARKAKKVTNLHHYKVEVFYTAIDRQMQELRSRFTETNTKLLLHVACLSPNNLFAAFDKEKLISLAKLYHMDFSEVDFMVLEDQLDTYYLDMLSSSEFQNLQGINALGLKLVQKRKHNVYPLVYRLLKLALILPVATASVERVFSAMKIVKNRLRNRMGDELLNYLLVTYIEKDLFCSLSNEVIMLNFQAMKPRRLQL